MFTSQLNSILIFTVLIHKVAASRPSMVSDLFLSCEFSVYKLPGRQRDALIHMSAAFGFAVSDSICLRSEFRLCLEASIKQDCGRWINCFPTGDEMLSVRVMKIKCRSLNTHTHVSTHTHTQAHTLNTSIQQQLWLLKLFLICASLITEEWETPEFRNYSDTAEMKFPTAQMWNVKSVLLLIFVWFYLHSLLLIASVQTLHFCRKRASKSHVNEGGEHKNLNGIFTD